MKKSINDNQKRRGRPATGTAPLVGVRMTLEFQKPIKAWAKSQDDRPTMAEAVRRLVAIGLGSVKVSRAQKRSDSPTARDLAAVQIDRLADSGAPAEEQASRKRHLLKGPEEFREARIDRPKRKT
ncbi:MAG: hypothetical protein E8A46_23430 [Bradyrhizobium sp.]|jgi:hypothetical protein|nr:MAG: hypothetical protein E8A46_23430 [Bradyrhizobium sp.]